MMKNSYAFNTTLNNKNIVISITEQERKKIMPDSVIYSCLILDADNDMTPIKRFTLVYSWKSKEYWAWTMDCIRNEDRDFRNSIANLFNSGELKVSA